MKAIEQIDRSETKENDLILQPTNQSDLWLEKSEIEDGHIISENGYIDVLDFLNGDAEYGTW
jgi:hypothetical protein